MGIELSAWGTTFLVALLLTGLLGTLVGLRVPPDARGAKHALLALVAPATLWAWEVVIREAFRRQYPSLWWSVLDVAMGCIAVTGLLVVLVWATGERD